MGSLVMTCPKTGRQVDTGIETDQRSIDLALPFVGRAYCAYCRMEHSFAKDDVLICEMVDGLICYHRAAA